MVDPILLKFGGRQGRTKETKKWSKADY